MGTETKQTPRLARNFDDQCLVRKYLVGRDFSYRCQYQRKHSGKHKFAIPRKRAINRAERGETR